MAPTACRPQLTDQAHVKREIWVGGKNVQGDILRRQNVSRARSTSHVQLPVEMAAWHPAGHGGLAVDFDQVHSTRNFIDLMDPHCIVGPADGLLDGPALRSVSESRCSRPVIGRVFFFVFAAAWRPAGAVTLRAVGACSPVGTLPMHSKGRIARRAAKGGPGGTNGPMEVT